MVCTGVRRCPLALAFALAGPYDSRVRRALTISESGRAVLQAVSLVAREAILLLLLLGRSPCPQHAVATDRDLAKLDRARRAHRIVSPAEHRDLDRQRFQNAPELGTGPFTSASSGGRRRSSYRLSGSIASVIWVRMARRPASDAFAPRSKQSRNSSRAIVRGPIPMGSSGEHVAFESSACQGTVLSTWISCGLYCASISPPKPSRAMRRSLVVPTWRAGMCIGGAYRPDSAAVAPPQLRVFTPPAGCPRPATAPRPGRRRARRGPGAPTAATADRPAVHRRRALRPAPPSR
jgi:hypothetical protein